jgi:predicted XRE-type DNA-binding protein
MKIRKVECNNQKKTFEVTTFSGRAFSYPYAKVSPSPDSDNHVHKVYPDVDFGREAFTYVLESGDEGTVHIDHLLEYSDDPEYMARLALHKLTVEARKRVEESPLSKREIMRRLGTSQAQLYRLLDPANYKKSMNQLVELLAAVDCEVEMVVRETHRTA